MRYGGFSGREFSLYRYFQFKREKFGIKEKCCALDVGVTVCHGTDRLKHCTYVYVLNILLKLPV